MYEKLNDDCGKTNSVSAQVKFCGNRRSFQSFSNISHDIPFSNEIQGSISELYLPSLKLLQLEGKICNKIMN